MDHVSFFMSLERGTKWWNWNKTVWDVGIVFDRACSCGVRDASVSTVITSCNSCVHCSMYSWWLQAMEQYMWIPLSLLWRSTHVSLSLSLSLYQNIIQRLMILFICKHKRVFFNEFVIMGFAGSVVGRWWVFIRGQLRGNWQEYIGSTTHQNLGT